MLWLAGDDPLRIAALEKMGILEYFLLLDKKITDINKANANHARRSSKRSH